MGQFGNSFDKTSVNYGHARKIWRSQSHVEPGGAVITNVADFVAAGKIQSGLPVKFDNQAKTMKVYTEAQVKSASDMATLGINGFLKEDVRILSADTVATGTVVYGGEIYEFMFDAAVVAKLKALTNLPMIHWVY